MQIFLPGVTATSSSEAAAPRLAEAIGLIATGPDGKQHGPFTTASSLARAGVDSTSATAQAIVVPVAAAGFTTAKAASNVPSGTSEARAIVSALSILNGVVAASKVVSQVSFFPDGSYTLGDSGIEGLFVAGLSIGQVNAPATIEIPGGTTLHLLEAQSETGGCERVRAIHVTTSDGWDIVAGESFACPTPGATLHRGQTLATARAGISYITKETGTVHTLGPASRLEAQGEAGSSATMTVQLPADGFTDAAFTEGREIVGSDAYATARGHVEKFAIPGLVELLAPTDAWVYAHANRTGADSGVDYNQVRLSVQGQELLVRKGTYHEQRITHPGDPSVEIGFLRVNEAQHSAGVDPTTGQNVATASIALIHLRIDPRTLDDVLGLRPMDIRVAFLEVEARSPGTPRLELEALASPAVARVGTPVTFSYAVSNTGSGHVGDASVVDSRAGAVGACDAALLRFGDFVSCELSRAVDDADDGGVPASAFGVGPEDESLEAHDVAPLRIIHPSLGLTVGNDPPKTHSGDEVVIDYTVTNTGDSPLSDVSVTDESIGEVGRVALLAPGDTQIMSATTTVAETEIHRVRAIGLDETGLPVTDDAEAVLTVIHPAIAVAVQSPQIVRAGDALTVVYTVENVGDAPLDRVTLEDDAAGVGASLGSLAPGARASTETVLTAPSGSFILTPRATGVDELGLMVEASAARPVRVIHSGLGLIVRADPPVVRDAGDVTWEYEATNLGDNALTEVTVNDRDAGQIAGGEVLRPGETLRWTRGAHVHETAGVAAQATALDESGQIVEADATGEARVIHPVLEIFADATPASAHLGDEVTLRLTVTNAGDSRVDDIAVSDSSFGTGGIIASLAPGESATLMLSGREQSDGRHLVGAAGEDEIGLPVTASTSVLVEMLSPRIGLSAIGLPGTAREGDQVVVSYTATNTGDTMLFNVLVHDETTGEDSSRDELAPGESVGFSFSTPAPPDSFLAVGRVGAFDKTGFLVRASATDDVRVIHPGLDVVLSVEPAVSRDGADLTWDYLVTNTGDSRLDDLTVADAVAGVIASGVTLLAGERRSWSRGEHIDSTTVASAAVAAMDESGQGIAGEDSATALVIHPALGIGVTASPSTAHEGDLVLLTLAVTNTGDSPVTDTIVRDSSFGFAGVIESLAPGESVTLYLDGRQGPDGLHVASADGSDEIGLAVSAKAASEVSIIHPALEVSLSITPSTVMAGEASMVTYTVTNAGDAELDGVRLEDPFIPTSWDIGPLPVGATVERTEHLTAPDSSATLTPVATGVDPTGLVVEDSAEAVLRVVHSSLIMVVSADPAVLRDSGTVTWTYTVVNTGDNTLSGVTISDSVMGAVATGLVLGAGESATFTLEQEIEADSTAVATAAGIDEALQEVAASASASVRVIHPSLSILAAPSTDAVRAGSDVTVTYVVTNTGDSVLSDVVVVDTSLGTVGAALAIPPGGTATFTAVFAPQADLFSSITASSTDELGGVVESVGTYAIDVQHPGLAVDKRASTLRVLPGESIVYEFVMTNIGDTPLYDIRVDDDHLGNVGTIATLAPDGSASLTVLVELSVTTRNNVIVTAPDGTGGFVEGADSESVTVDDPVPYNLGAPTSQWVASGGLPASVANGASSKAGFVATNPSGSPSRIYGLVVGVASDAPHRVRVDPDAAGLFRLTKADGTVLFDGVLDPVSAAVPFARFDPTGLKQAGVTTYRLPTHVFLEGGGRLEATVSLGGGEEAGGARMVVFWPSTEDSPGGSAPRTWDSVADFTNMFPARGGWYPLHNSFDAWDTGTGGHAWMQYSWTTKPTSDAFAKVEFVIDNRR